MRTLKKTLCLVLCLAMMAGLCLVGTSAAFTDADEITYKEAVDVLTAIGVINGVTDTEFAPAATLTRAQACKIIAYLKGAGDLTATSSFADVQGHWAEAYVAYCAQQGIVDGVGDNKFDPEGTLKGAAWAKMLLCAEGYRADVEGMTGANWEIGVGLLVKKLDLAAGIKDFNGTAAVSRDAACQMAFNALEDKMVEYTGGSSVEVNGVTITTGATRGFAGTTLADNFPTLVINGDLSNTDNYGRHAVSVSYKGAPVGTYYASNETVLAYTAATAAAKITADAKAAGYTMTAANADAVAAVTKNGVEAYAYFKDGVYYGCGATDDAVVAAANVSVALPVAATKTTGAYTVYTVNGTAYKVFSTVVNPVTDRSEAVIEGKVDGKAPVLTYTDAAGKVHICEMAVVTGNVTSASTKNGTITYTVGGEAKVVSDVTGASATATVGTKNASYYVDRFGNLAANVDPAAAAVYVALGDKTVQTLNTEDNTIVTTIYAEMVATDGTVKEFKVASAGLVAAGFSYTMTPNAQGVYTPADATAGTVTGITAKAATLTGSALYVNAKTIFAFAEFKADGVTPTFTVKTVTGKDSVGTYSAIPAGKAIAIDADGDSIADIVVVVANVLPATSTKLAYVTGNYEVTEIKAGLQTVVYEAYVNGELSTITVKTASPFAGSGLVSYTATSISAQGTTAATAIGNLGDMLTVNGTVDAAKKVAADVPVYVINDATGNKTVNTYNFGDLSEMTITGYHFVTKPGDANTITAIYVTI